MEKPITKVSEATLKRRLKALYALSTLTQEQTETRNSIEKRLYELYREKHPPIHTPPGFVDKTREDEW